MKTQLQVIGDALATLQQPENLLQLVVIAGALLLLRTRAPEQVPLQR